MTTDISAVVDAVKYIEKIPSGCYPANGGCLVCAKQRNLVLFPATVEPTDALPHEGQLALCTSCLTRAYNLLPDVQGPADELEAELDKVRADRNRLHSENLSLRDITESLATYINRA